MLQALRVEGQTRNRIVACIRAANTITLASIVRRFFAGHYMYSRTHNNCDCGAFVETRSFWDACNCSARSTPLHSVARAILQGQTCTVLNMRGNTFILGCVPLRRPLHSLPLRRAPPPRTALRVRGARARARAPALLASRNSSYCCYKRSS